MNIKLDITHKESLFGLDGNGRDIDLELAGDEVGDLADHSHVVDSNDLDTGKKRDLLVLGPFGLDHTMSVVRQQLGRVGTSGSVDGQSLSGSNKPENIVTRNRLAAVGQIINDLIAAFAKNDQLGILTGHQVMRYDLWPLRQRSCFDRLGGFDAVAR